MSKRTFLIILLFLLLGTIFRTYRPDNFLYWSDDEQQQWYMLRHIIVDRHPSLVMPNAALGVGLNPLYHYFLVPFYLLARFNPINLQSLGLIFFFVSLPVLYYTGRVLAGARVGLISAFLYATSFVSALFDKRLWALSPNFFVVTIGLLAIVKLVQKKYRYLFLLIPALVLPFSSDPSLGIVFLPILCLSLLRVKIPKRNIFALLLAVLLLLSPLVLFELRHNFGNTRSLINTVGQHQEKQIREDVSNNNFLLSQIENFSRYLYLNPSEAAESIFCYCFLDDKIPRIILAAVVFGLAYFLYLTVKSRNKNYWILMSFLGSYFIGKYIFQEFFKGYPAFFYSLAISPVVFLIAAIVLSKLNKILMIIVIALVFCLNVNSLLGSQFKYPLSDRIVISQRVSDFLAERDLASYSLYYSGDILISGGGYNSLFHHKGRAPASGSLWLYWGHLYDSYELHKFGELQQDTIVIVSEQDLEKSYPKTPLFRTFVANLRALVYDNKSKWFIPDLHLEKLYQPRYFAD